jgi:H+/Cl- antiporter ClcA
MAILIGIVCGLLGALFVTVNTYVNMFRKIFLTNRFLKPLECVLISFFTVTFWFWTPYLANAHCKPANFLNPYARDLAV